MIIAFRYGRRKYRERQERQAALTSPSDHYDQDHAPPGADGFSATAAGTAGTSAGSATHATHADAERNDGRLPESRAQPVGAARAAAAAPVPKSKTKSEKAELSPEEVADKKKRRSYRWKIIIGLAGPFALQALDMTIVASALPYIASDFHQVKQLNWIITAFNLTSAAFLPFWAQLADIFGRHSVIQSAIVLIIVGSAICTGSPTSAFGVLLLGRALQGIGVAGVNIAVRTILADRVSLNDFAVNWSIFSVVAAIAFSIGPVIGGYLTTTSWRWCFAINLPIAVISIIIVIIVLRRELLGAQPLPKLEATDTRHGRFLTRLATIDYGGQILFLWGLGLLCLALTWGGGTYSWDSPAVISTLVIGGVLTIVWVLYERSMSPGYYMARVFPLQSAMMPWELISQREIGLLFFINFCTGVAQFAVMYFMDLYFAIVEGRSSSNAGVALLYYLPGLGVGAYMALFFSNIWPRQTIPSLTLGSLTAAIGISVLPYAIAGKRTALIYGMMALVGHGVGMRLNPGALHGLAYFPTMTAQISCLVSFALPFGGIVGLTVMSTVFNNKSSTSSSDSTGSSNSSSSTHPNTDDAKEGVKFAFIAIIPFMWLCVLVSTFLGNVWILKDGSHEVVNGAYVWSLVTRRKLTRERRVRGGVAAAGEEEGEQKERIAGDVEGGHVAAELPSSGVTEQRTAA